MSKEFDRVRIPVAVLTAMAPMAQMLSANRIVLGVAIPYPCGDPHLPDEEDFRLRRQLVREALETLEHDVRGATVFEPPVLKMIGAVTY
jgi:glycine reductase complex component B subunit gamma